MLGVSGRPARARGRVGMSYRQSQGKLHWGHLGRPVGAGVQVDTGLGSPWGKPTQDGFGRLAGAVVGAGLGHGVSQEQTVLNYI